MADEIEKRAFDRIKMDLLMQVSADDKSGNTYQDKALLKDISGGGVNFSTRLTDKYFCGQSLKIIIELPGTGDVKARMKAKATVLRIDSPEDTDKKERDQQSNVAARFDIPLTFERLL